MIKERDHPFGLWRLQGPAGEESVKVTGPLSANHGEVVHQWCVDGRGILLRSLWDVADSLASGKLVQILPDYQQPANIWAVYAAPLASSAKIRVTVEFFRQYFAERYGAMNGDLPALL
ncbi:HTH-type transcriptional regulator DmlR [compost metagenome]